MPTNADAPFFPELAPSPWSLRDYFDLELRQRFDCAPKYLGVWLDHLVMAPAKRYILPLAGEK